MGTGRSGKVREQLAKGGACCSGWRERARAGFVLKDVVYDSPVFLLLFFLLVCSWDASW